MLTQPDQPLVRPPASAEALRRNVLTILLFSMAGALLDLLMIEHYGEWRQQIPLLLLGFTILALIGHALLQTNWMVRVVQGSMMLLAAGGILGLVFHYQVSAAFQLEMDESMPWWKVVRNVLRATAPPALAPMAMVQMGLIGVACLYRHPLCRTSEKPILDQGDLE